MNDISTVNAAAFGGHFHNSLLGMILNAGTMVQFVLLLLLAFSVVSWAIIIMKYLNFKKVRTENERFLDVYMKNNRLSDVFPEAKKFSYSTMAEVFRVGYDELIIMTKALRQASLVTEADEAVHGPVEMKGIDNIERALNRAAGSEATKLESTLAFLATTGSASPFIGLFGTVWGIMDTFKGIGARGAATLAVVAPGISEALIATAAGLAAAIPAVIFYNYYLNRIKTMTMEMDHFSSEFLNIVERNYVRR